MSTLLKLNGVTLPGTGYPTLDYFKFPYFANKQGLIGAYFFEDNLQKSLINYANASLPLIAKGNVTVGADGAVISDVNYFDTRLPETAEYTVLAICLPTKPTSTADSQLIYNNYLQTDTTNRGESVGFGSGDLFLSYQTRTDNTVFSRTISTSGLVTTRHAAFGARVSADGKTKLFIHDNGLLTSSAESAAQARLAPNTTRTMLIGAGYETSTSFNGSLTIKALAVWNRAKTDDEVIADMNYMATIYPDLMAM